MGTHAMIAIQNVDLTIDSVFCHYDGYLSYTGILLYTIYNNENKIRELLSYGNMKSLHKDLPDSQSNECMQQSKDMTEFLKHAKSFGSNLIYVFSDNEWSYKFTNDDKWIKLCDMDKRLKIY